MIFNDDAILISLLERYDNEDELKDAIVKYCNGGTLEVNRPNLIDTVKGDTSEIDLVIIFQLNICRLQAPQTASSTWRKERDWTRWQQKKKSIKRNQLRSQAWSESVTATSALPLRCLKIVLSLRNISANGAPWHKPENSLALRNNSEEGFVFTNIISKFIGSTHLLSATCNNKLSTIYLLLLYKL